MSLETSLARETSCTAEEEDGERSVKKWRLSDARLLEATISFISK